MQKVSDMRKRQIPCHLPTTPMGGTYSATSWDATIGQAPSQEGPALVITTDAVKQLATQIKEQKGEKVREIET